MRVLGIDIGGTFTDLALCDTATGAIHTHKVLTTPADPVAAVVEGVRELLAQAGGAPPERVVHGTTLVTNAVVERKGASTALLTTRGFRDVLEIRREGRYDLYDLEIEFPEPLVPRSRRIEADERRDERGAVLIPFDTARLERELAGITGVESWAVCFLHAYADDTHEREAAAVLRRCFPGVPVSVSSRVAPEIREYERTSTTVANAYVRPVAEGYLTRLTESLGAACGGAAPPALHIMQSDGGWIAPETAAELPIRIVESGPAGGVIAADRLGRALGADRILSLDMGGTTAKIAFLDAHGPRTESSFEIDRRYFYRKGSGLPLLTPALDLVEIGAGGGSLARRGPLGTLEVGPSSAGADPGPACYGRGGTQATVTDADVALGLLDPGYFLGGRLRLDAEAARAAVERDVATPLGIGVEEAAHGAYRAVTDNMAAAARVHAAERGIDLAGHLLVAFGGAGPVHAWAVARRLRVPRVLFPSHAGVESALGFLAAPPSFETVRSDTRPLDDGFDAVSAAALLHELAREAEAAVPVGPGEVAVRAWADMRYRGQGAEVRVPLAGLTVQVAALREAFHAVYCELYGREVHGVPVEIVTWRVRADRDPEPLPVFDAASAVAERPGPEPHTMRRAWLPDLDAPASTPVYRRDSLREGMTLAGPALIEEAQSTLVLGRGRARVLRGGHVLCDLEGA